MLTNNLYDLLFYWVCIKFLKIYIKKIFGYYLVFFGPFVVISPNLKTNLTRCIKYYKLYELTLKPLYNKIYLVT